MNFCIHRAHHRGQGDTATAHLCTNAEAWRRDRVTGNLIRFPDDAELQCYEARQRGWPCGEAGRLWRKA